MPFKKGVSGNPNGRPKLPEIEEFRAALREVESEKGKTLLKHSIEKSFENENVLIAILKKILPDKIEDESFKNLARTFLVRAVEGMKEDIKNAD